MEKINVILDNVTLDISMTPLIRNVIKTKLVVQFLLEAMDKLFANHVIQPNLFWQVVIVNHVVLVVLDVLSILLQALLLVHHVQVVTLKKIPLVKNVQLVVVLAHQQLSALLALRHMD